MAFVSVLEIEELYGTNDTNRGNQMMAVAGEALLGYIKQEAPEHTVANIQQKTIPAKDIKIDYPEYEGGDLDIDDQAVVTMILEQAKMAGQKGEALVVGIRSVTPFFSHATRLAGKIKAAIAKLREETERTTEQSIPKVRIVIGGYHASGMTPAIRKRKEQEDPQLKAGELFIGEKYKLLEEKLHGVDSEAELVDAFVVGEGEETFLDLVNYYERLENGVEGKELEKIPGVVFREGGSVKFTGKREEMRDSKKDYSKLTLPEPHRFLTLPLLKSDEEGRVIGLREVPSSAGCTQVGSFPGDEDIRGEIGMGASRGCNQRCEYCSSADVWCAVRFRDPVALVKEAAKYWSDPRFRTNFIYFYDLSFNAYYEEHSNALCEAMKNARRLPSGEIVVDPKAEGERIFGTDEIDRIHWFCLSEVFDIPKDEHGKEDTSKVENALSLMADSGCTKIGYGIEGFTPKDIVHLKRLDRSKSDEEVMEQGIERFAKTAWVLKKTAENGISPRGYFIWGTENQDNSSFEKAMALFTAEVPNKVFASMDDIKAVMRHLFIRQEKGDLKPDIAQFVQDELGYSPEEAADQSRLLEIDHLRIGYETPYPNTDVARERDLRYFEYCRDEEEGFFLHDERGKLVPEYYTADDVKLQMSLVDGKPVYYLDGKEVTDLSGCHKEVDKRFWESEIESITLEKAIKKGWDDWELLIQEVPILESDILIEDMEKHQGEFINRFYTSPAYRRSMESKVEKRPRDLEAVYAWQKFWNDRIGRPTMKDGERYFDFLSDEQKEEAERKLVARLDKLGISGDEREKWIEKHLLKGRDLPREGDVHIESEPTPGPHVS